jgi:hypothetical protein
VDVKAGKVSEEFASGDPELDFLRKSEASLRSTLSFVEEDAAPESR